MGLTNKAAIKDVVSTRIAVRAERASHGGLKLPAKLRISAEVMDAAERAANRAVNQFIEDGFERGKFQRRGKTLFVRG